MTDEVNEGRILPCPFCGSDDLTVTKQIVNGHIFCNDCFAEKPLPEKSWDVAIQAWNTRTPAIADGVGVEDRKKEMKSATQLAMENNEKYQKEVLEYTRRQMTDAQRITKPYMDAELNAMAAVLALPDEQRKRVVEYLRGRCE